MNEADRQRACSRSISEAWPVRPGPQGQEWKTSLPIGSPGVTLAERPEIQSMFTLGAGPADVPPGSWAGRSPSACQ